MRGFFQRMTYSLQRLMAGRYGYDEFSKFLLIAAVVFSGLSYFPDLQMLYFVSVILLVYSLFRVMSKNFDKRRRELEKYFAVKRKITGRFSAEKKRWSERKTHRFFKCKNCKTVLRVPKGKGKIKISCPKCRNEIIKKT